MPTYIPASAEKGKKTIWKPSHQDCSAEPHVPKYIYVNKNTALPQAWKGAENWVEFLVPMEMGILTGMTIAFDVANSADAAVSALPTPFWCSRIETYLGTDIIETAYADDQYHETIGFRTAQQVDQINEVVNIEKDYTIVAANSDTTPPVPVGNSRYYLPLDANVLAAMRPFIQGFSAQFKVRLYFATSIQVGTPENPPSDISLTDVTLICEEAQLSQTEYHATAMAHRGVVDYSIIVRERQQEGVQFSDANTKPIYLRSFKNRSAGLLVYSTAQSPTASARLLRSRLKDLTLQDAMGNKMTEVLRGDFLKAFIWAGNVDSPFVTSGSNNNVYLMPFSASFQDSVLRGCDFGNFKFSTQEKLMITPASVLGDQLVTAVSYSHGNIVCAGGKHYIQMRS